MINETIEIDIPYDKLGIEFESKATRKATITTYIKDIYSDYQDAFNRPLIIICPGGGYDHHSPRCGEPIAIKMLDLGYNALVLRYSYEPIRFPASIYEMAYTVKYARDHAKEWDVDPNKIIVAGFSAGGHLAAYYGTNWNSDLIKPLLEDCLKCDNEYVKPNGMLLGYPVITSGEFAHVGTFNHMLGDKVEELKEDLSVEKLVGKDTPPAFIWHTFEDGSVPVENSLLIAKAMREQEIPFDLHIFSKGCHGLALGTRETASKNLKHYEPMVSPWPELFKNWMGVMYE